MCFPSGKPLIARLTEDRGADDPKLRVLTCEAEGVPEPQFEWSINTTAVSVDQKSSKCGAVGSRMKIGDIVV